MRTGRTLEQRRQALRALARWGLFVALLLAFILVPFMLLEGRMNEVVQHSLRISAHRGRHFRLIVDAISA